MMKNFLLGTTIAIITSTAASADVVRARITHVEPRYETVYQNNPTTQCYDVEVPVYGNTGGGATGGDVLGGMIIGGLLGKGATGNDRGAAAGAVLGGMIAADNNNGRRVVTGYRVERQCEQVNTKSRVRQIKNYFIRFEWNGHRGQAYTYNNYRVGDRIDATVSVTAN
jgi:uncharacterized protein YcfJ